MPIAHTPSFHANVELDIRDQSVIVATMATMVLISNRIWYHTLMRADRVNATPLEVSQINVTKQQDNAFAFKAVSPDVTAHNARLKDTSLTSQHVPARAVIGRPALEHY